MLISRALANAAGALTGRNFRVAKGEYGDKLVMTGPWQTRVADYMRQRNIRELELNYVKGFKHPADTPEFLTELPTLEGIEITYAPFEDLTALNGLTGLRYLLLGFSRSVRGLKLECLPGLEKIALEWFKGASGLFKLKALRNLALFFYPGKEGSKPFSFFKNIEELRLSSSGLCEIESFAVMKNLRRLELLAMNRLESLCGIEELSNLRTLRIETCKKIESIDAVSGLTELTYLSFSDCGKIASVGPLRKLKKLEILHFFESTNVVDGDLSVLHELPNLKDVRFQNRRHYNVKREEFPPFRHSQLEAAGQVKGRKGPS